MIVTIWSMVVNQPLKRKGTPKDSDKAASEISGEEKRSEAHQPTQDSDGANSFAPSTLECFLQDTASHRRQDARLFVQAFSLAAIAASHLVKLNLESERKEDENVESGPKDYISEVSESALWASIRDYLTPPDVVVVRTTGLKWTCAKMEMTKGFSQSGPACAWITVKISVSIMVCSGHAWSTS